jgi:hypothetical protein
MIRKIEATKIVAMILVFTTVLFACERHGSKAKNTDKRDNVIIILFDALRADRMGVYGYSKPTTPYIDTFAKESLIFEDHSSCHFSTVVSLPQLFSGVFHVFKPIDWIPTWKAAATALPEGYRFFVDDFKDAGYHTVLISAHKGLHTSFLSTTFDEKHFLATYSKPGYPSIFELNSTVEEILDQGHDKPLFLYIHVMETHFPHPKNEFYSLFSEDNDPKFRVKFRRDGKPYRPRELKYLSAIYDSDVRLADKGFEELIDLLRGKGLYESSHIILTADHGELIGERDNYVGHAGKPWQELISVPLIWKWPDGLFKGQTVSFPTTHLDVKPTLVSTVLGTDALDSQMYDGRVLIKNGKVNNESERMVPIVGGFRYGNIKYFSYRGKQFMYNLALDPEEELNFFESFSGNVALGIEEEFIYPDQSFYAFFNQCKIVNETDLVSDATIGKIDFEKLVTEKEDEQLSDGKWSLKNGEHVGVWLWSSPLEQVGRLDCEFTFDPALDGVYDMSVIMAHSRSHNISTIEISLDAGKSWRRVTATARASHPLFFTEPILPCGEGRITEGRLRISIRPVKGYWATLSGLRLTPLNEQTGLSGSDSLSDEEEAERLRVLKSLGYIQ